MKIHEYQAKQLLKAYGVPVPEGVVVTSAEDARKVAEQYGPCMVKAQVHAGGRGKAGGVKFASDPDKARQVASDILGMTLVNRQTGPEGKLVRKVLVTKAVDVQKEYYLGIALDSANATMVIIASASGGMEIEETSKNDPSAIIRVPVSIMMGYKRYEGLQIADALGLAGSLQEELIDLLGSMTKLFVEKDCSLVEVNPLVLTTGGHLLCLDAKVTFDDNALFRHPDIQTLRDVDEEDTREWKASQYGLNYITLDGDVGCLVNGAGLAMATMDIIKSYGGSPANFLDVGGSATAEKVKMAFEILLSDKQVKVIFINIFGGIMKCDIIAEGVVSAVRETGLSIPLVVRLEGTNADKGRQVLKESGLPIISATDMADGARKAVACCKGELQS